MYGTILIEKQYREHVERSNLEPICMAIHESNSTEPPSILSVGNTSSSGFMEFGWRIASKSLGFIFCNEFNAKTFLWKITFDGKNVTLYSRRKEFVENYIRNNGTNASKTIFSSIIADVNKISKKR